MYTKELFIKDGLNTFTLTDGNIVDIPDVGTLMLYDTPLIGFSSASDTLFDSFKRPEIIGRYFFTPKEWLPSAQTVISFFLPFTKAVRSSNRIDNTDPSTEWL